METLIRTATAALAATATTTTAAAATEIANHNGVAPAAAMPTPFDLPCGVDFLSNEFHKNQELRDRCGPPNFDDYWWSTVGYYSPAVCPRGYTAGCFRWNSAQGPPVEPTETAVQCVPRGYKCSNADISNAFSGTATAPMIQIRWATTDLTALATHPLYYGASPTNTEEDYLKIRVRNSTDDSDSGSGSGSSSGNRHGRGGGGLSAGAKAGIGIGVSLGVILIFTSIGLIIWRARTSSKRSQSFQTHPPQMVQSQYATQQAFSASQSGPPAPTGGPIPMGGPSPEQYYGGQAASQPAPQPQPMQPVFHQQNMSPQHQHHPSASEMDNSTAAGNSNWGGSVSNMTPPPVAVVAGSAAANTRGSSISSPQPAASELDSVRTPVEMGSGSPAVHHVQPEQQQQQQQQVRSASTDPQAFVGAPPGEPSAEELTSLREQHSQLEQRRQRILELERIEQEQETLRNRMGQMQGGHNQKHELP